MEWRKCYLDLMLVPFGLFLNVVYHCWLWHVVIKEPMKTYIGVNSAARRQWVVAIMKDIDKKNILAVQTLRNTMMVSILMATTTILLCTGLGAVISSTYSIKKPLNDSIYGAHGELVMALKYTSLLIIFLFAFIFNTLSLRLINQVNYLINTPVSSASIVTVNYVCDLLDKGFILNTVGNRLVYVGLPLLLWIFGPVLVFMGSVFMIPIFYYLDVFMGKVESENKDLETA